MALVGTGITGDVTSWANNAGGAGELHVGVAGSAESAFTLRYRADEIDATAFLLTNRSATQITGLTSWDGTITQRLDSAVTGVGGSVTWSQLGATLQAIVRSWSLTLTAPPIDVTTFSTTGPRSFVSGVMSWAASMQVFLDSTAVLPAPGSSSSLTLQISTGNTLAGTAYLVGWDTSVGPNNQLIATVNAMGTGTLTATDGGGNFFGAGAITPDDDPEANSSALVLQSSTGQTYTGDAMWTSVTIDCPVDGLVSCAVNYQGSGALTIA